MNLRPQNLPILFVAFCASLACGACTDFGEEPDAPYFPEMKGFCYTAFASNGFTLGGQTNAVGDLRSQIGNNWIALSVFEYQSTSLSNDIGPNTTGINPLSGGAWSTTSTEEDVREGVRQARLHQMKIMLKPHVDLYSGEWRAMIHPDSSWFRSYTAVITRYARLASDLDIEMLCIGTEFVVATQPAYTAAWSGLIDSVKRYYHGTLTYAANWNGAAGISTAEFEQVGFWDRLDYVGIDSYFPLTASPDDPIPSVPVAMERMRAPVQTIGAVSSRFGKHVIFTEIGIQSVRGALASPWDFFLGRVPGAVQDNEVQEFYYRVMIEALGRQPWCAGLFWWNWESVPSSYAGTNYTPRNKPAARVLREWHSYSFAIHN